MVVAMLMVALELAAIATPMPDSTFVAMAIAAPVFTVNFAPQHSSIRLTRQWRFGQIAPLIMNSIYHLLASPAQPSCSADSLRSWQPLQQHPQRLHHRPSSPQPPSLTSPPPSPRST